MKRDTSVMVYNSTSSGIILGYNSDVKNILNACITGYGNTTATIAVGAGGVATFITAGAHNFTQWQVVQISGATQTEWNSNWKIENILSSTSFTVLTDFAEGASETGINVKIAPLTSIGTADNYSFQGYGLTVTNSTLTSTFNYGGYSRTLEKSFSSGETSVAWYLITDQITLFLVCVTSSGQRGVALFKSPTQGHCYIHGGSSWYSASATIASLAGTTNVRIKAPNAWISISSFGQYGTFFTSGVNPVNNEYVYYPIFMQWNTGGSSYQGFGIIPKLFALLGAPPANGIYNGMLHFVGSNGYGFCFNII